MADAGIREALVREGASRLLDARLQTIVRVASPVAGAEWSTPVPGGTYWQLLSVRYVLTTSAVVANRQPSLVALDGDGNQLWRTATSSTVAASLAAVVVYLAGFGYSGTAAPLLGGLPSPPAILLGGWSLRTATGSIDVADQYSGIVLTAREFSESQLAQELAVIAEALGSIL